MLLAKRGSTASVEPLPQNIRKFGQELLSTLFRFFVGAGHLRMGCYLFAFPYFVVDTGSGYFRTILGLQILDQVVDHVAPSAHLKFLPRTWSAAHSAAKAGQMALVRHTLVS